MSTAAAPVTLALACAAALALAGCSDDAADPSPGPSDTTTRPSVSAIRDLSDINCRQDDGSWDFRATLTNPGDTAATYTVTVAVTAKADGAVVGSTELTETLDPDESVDLTADDFHTGSETDVLCVPSATKVESAG